MKKVKQGFKCVVCGRWKLGWGENKQYGNNPYPYEEKGQCCDECNSFVVIPFRMQPYIEKKKEVK